MAVVARKEYVGVARDVVENFAGKQLVYVSWDRHLLFASPFMLCLEPSMKFGDMVHGPLTMLMGPDPDAGQVEWTRVEWFRANKAFVPDFDKTLAENGVMHKDQLRMHTPGMNTLGAK
jgi:phenol/toluene 2-monooxygenase (NADH) P4/A4